MTALCSYCKKDMSDGATISCTGNKTIDGRYFKDNKARQAIPHDGNGRCGDCNVAPGGYHHLNCDMERCPKCKGQLISCGCLAAPPPPPNFSTVDDKPAYEILEDTMSEGIARLRKESNERIEITKKLIGGMLPAGLTQGELLEAALPQVDDIPF